MEVCGFSSPAAADEPGTSPNISWSGRTQALNDQQTKETYADPQPRRLSPALGPFALKLAKLN